MKEGCGGGGGLNISYLTSSPKPLHGFKKNLTGSKYPRSSLKFVYFGPINQFSIHSISLFFFFKENTCIIKHSVCATQLSSNRITKLRSTWNWSEDRGLIVMDMARIRTHSPEGSTVIVIISHNRVLRAVNNNSIMIKRCLLHQGGCEKYRKLTHCHILSTVYSNICKLLQVCVVISATSYKVLFIR